jgi:hypothetical protein
VDWLSASVRLHTEEATADLVEYLDALGRRILPGSEWAQEGKGRFYATKRRHECGLQIQYSDPFGSASVRHGVESRPVPNSGLASIEVPGSIWGFLDQSERSDLITDIRHWPGFIKATRLDLETTLLEQEQDAEWIVGEVAAGRLWPKGFGVGMAYANRNLHGDLHGACTQYFGGKESRIRSRHYDKAAEAGWKVPAVRHEVQLRDEPADQHFRRLANRCETEEPAGPLLMTAEAATVKDALGSLVDFRDTARWEGRRKPRNWALVAEVPEWWRKVVGPAPAPLAVEYRPPGDLEASVEALLAQYGRKLGLWALERGLSASEAVPVAATDLLLRAIAGVDEGDWKVLAQLHPDQDPAKLREWFCISRARAQSWADRSEGAEVSTTPS